MDKNTKMLLTVGAVGVVAYVLLRKKKSDTIQGEPSEQDLGQDPAEGDGDVGGEGEPNEQDLGQDPADGDGAVGGDVVDPPPPPEVFRFSISSDTAGALQLQFLPTPNLVGDAQGFIPFARIEAGETLTFEIPADVAADVPVDMGYVAPDFVVAYINYNDRTQSLQYTIGLNDDYREIKALTYDTAPINLPIRKLVRVARV
jgi:hypothetical protein